MYSTCSLDPIENEAVVAEVLRQNRKLKLISAHDLIPNLIASEGMKHWPVLSDDCSIVQENENLDCFHPPSESRIGESLPLCMRVWNDQSKAGGFFLAVFEKELDSDDDTNVEIEHRLSDEEEPQDNENLPQPITLEVRESLEVELGSLPRNLWLRGKKILWTTPEAKQIWESKRSRRGGRIRISGNRWRPLKVVYLGLNHSIFRRKIQRVVGSAAKLVSKEIDLGKTIVNSKIIDSLLSGEEPEPSSVDSSLSSVRGNHYLIDNLDGTTIPVWIGGRIT